MMREVVRDQRRKRAGLLAGNALEVVASLASASAHNEAIHREAKVEYLERERALEGQGAS